MGLRDWLKSGYTSPVISVAPNVSEKRTDPATLISQELMQEIGKSVRGHHSSDRVLYSDEKQYLHIVGESFRGEAFQALRTKYQSDGADEEIDVWFSGVLLPEPTNQYDPHAIMVVLFDPDRGNGGITPLHVGYIERESAAKHQSQIIKLWKESKVIPLLLRVNGGTSDKPSFGISARAMTSAIRF